MMGLVCGLSHHRDRVARGCRIAELKKAHYETNETLIHVDDGFAYRANLVQTKVTFTDKGNLSVPLPSDLLRKERVPSVFFLQNITLLVTLRTPKRLPT